MPKSATKAFHLSDDDIMNTIAKYRYYSWNEIAFSTLLAAFSLAIIASVVWEPLKYLKYGLPIISPILLLVFQKRIFVDLYALKRLDGYRYLSGLLFLYLILLSVNVFVGFRNARFFLEGFFILAPLLFSFFLFLLKPESDILDVTRWLFAAIAISFFIERFDSILFSITHPGSIFGGLANSELDSESNFSFQFGMFLIIYAYHRKWLFAILSAVLMVLSFKRIAIAAVIIIGLLTLVKKLSSGRLDPIRNKWLIMVGNLLVVTILFLFFTGVFDDLVMQLFGVSPNFLTVGRYDVYTDIFNHFGNVRFFGFGLGSINTYLSGAGYQLVNLHSDVLKVFFELGPPAFLFWIYMFHKWPDNFLCAALAVYMNILFFTDNVFIYFDVLFCFYLLIFYAKEKK